MYKKKSLFLTFEGIEGSGKTYQSKKLLQEIDGMNEIDQIYKEIQQIIHSLET